MTDPLRAEVETIATVSDKILFLARQGMPRAEIARLLGKRYQHVRKVLARDAAKLSWLKPTPLSAASTILRLKLSADRTLVLPPAALAAPGLPRGGAVAARIEEGAIRHSEPVAALRRVLKRLEPLRARLAAEGCLGSNELITERRREAEG